MYKGSSILGIIPARSGSKGIKNKNIISLNNIPLIAYTIRTAIKSNIFDKIIVSTDSKKIAEIALKYGAEIPFIRPKIISTDNSSAIDVLHHAIEKIWKDDKPYEYIFYLQPTSPLRSEADILNSIQLMIEKKADSIISVCISENNPLWINQLPIDNSLSKFIRKKYQNINRQKLPAFYRLNGAIYLLKSDYIRKTDNWIGKNSFAYIMPKDRSIDIDEEYDLIKCEYILSRTKKV